MKSTPPSVQKSPQASPRLAFATLAAMFVFMVTPQLELAAAPSSNAYRVEVIILRAINPATAENLTLPAEGRGFNGRYAAGGTQPMVLRVLDSANLQMTDLAARIARSGQWQVLAHAGWVQTATGWPRHAGIPLASTGIFVPGLTGQFYVESGQLLHFGMQLTLSEAETWQLTELRSIKFNERHYFDHPGFAVIATVSRG